MFHLHPLTKAVRFNKRIYGYKTMGEPEELSKRIKQGKSARHQILFNKEEIDEALGRGYSKADVWRTLKDEGKFNRSYNSFLEAYNKLENIRRSPKTKEPQEPQTPVTEDNTEFVKKKKFTHDATPKSEDLI